MIVTPRNDGLSLTAKEKRVCWDGSSLERCVSPTSPTLLSCQPSLRELSVILDEEEPGAVVEKQSFDDPGGLRASWKRSAWTRAEFAQNMDEVEAEPLYGERTMMQKIKPLMVIGQGAFGTVRLGVHLPTLRLVALKEVCLLGRSADFQDAVMRELRVERHLLVPLVEEGPPTWIHRHLERTGAVQPCPNLANYFGALADRNRRTVTFVLEYMDGGSLKSLVDRGGLRQEKLLAHVAKSVASALKHLHDLNIAHLDVKPSNCLANHRGQVKLADLGLATNTNDRKGRKDTFQDERPLHEEDPFSSEKEVGPRRGQRRAGGSLSYLSPQRLDGDVATFSDDVWAFGVSLLLIACGPTKPFSRPRSHWELQEAIASGIIATLPPLQGEEVTRGDGSLGDGFSYEFHDFIQETMKQKDRPSMDSLLKHAFIVENTFDDFGNDLKLAKDPSFQAAWQEATNMRPFARDSEHFKAIVDAIADGDDRKINDDDNATDQNNNDQPTPQRARRASCPSTLLSSSVPAAAKRESSPIAVSVWRRTSQRLLAHALQRPPRLSVLCTSLYRNLQHLSSDMGIDAKSLLDAIDTARHAKEQQTKQLSSPKQTKARPSRRWSMSPTSPRLSGNNTRRLREQHKKEEDNS